MNSTYHNVFVGISISIKTISIDSINEIIRLAFSEFKSRRLVFLLADRIDLINKRIFESGNAITFENCIKKRSLELTRSIKKGISIYPRNSEFIDIISWNNILNHAYWSLYIDIFSKFIENEDFRNDLLKITHMFATRKGKYISDSKSRYLATYLIAELPTLINGIQYKDKWYRSMIYPMYRNEGIDDIAEKLIDGKYGIFPSIKNKCIIKNILIN